MTQATGNDTECNAAPLSPINRPPIPITTGRTCQRPRQLAGARVGRGPHECAHEVLPISRHAPLHTRTPSCLIFCRQLVCVRILYMV